MSNYKSIFYGRSILIATKHRKELVIAPLLQDELGVSCRVSENFDTDLLGTFTGEIERKDDPVTTLRKKCLIAMELNHCDLVVASEGSFGPHPNLYFIPADDELIMLIDKKNNIEILSREISTETNYDSSEIRTEKELVKFAEKALFPTHKLILRAKKDGKETIVKDIISISQLLESFKNLKSEYNYVSADTDMRAMSNPTRMKIIRKACEKLVKDIKSCCPDCGFPGFKIKEVKSGLPCALCAAPTKSTLGTLKKCMKCQYIEEHNYPDGKYSEDPMYCDFCNP